MGLNVGSGKTLSVAGTLVVTGAASTIDATAIGATTADTGAFTSLTASSTLGVTGVSTLTGGAVVQGLTVGRGAGAVSTNTAVGASAFTTNSTGATSVAVGAFSLGLNSTGNDNTVVGYGAGYYITGSGNTAVGRSTLSSGSPSTGGSNTAVGFYALQTNTSGNYGTSIGYQSGYSSSTADYNTFIGYRAGYSTTGDQNTFLGKFAGNAVTSGATNTIVGAYNGNQGGLDIRTASNYTVISDGGGTPHLAAYAGGTVALQGAIPVAGTGITFPATRSASSNANTLDDYEEGTWTPTVTATSGSYTSYTSSGTYTVVGRLVTMTSYFVVTNKGTGSGIVKLTNIPFGAAALTGGGSYTSSGINENTGNITCAEMFNAAPTTAYIGTSTGGDPVTANQGYSTSFTFYTS